MCSRQSNEPRKGTKVREREWRLGDAESPICLVQKE